MPEKKKRTTKKRPEPKSASLERLQAALALPSGTPEEALVASSAIIEELLLHQKRFRQMLRNALRADQNDMALGLKKRLVETAGLIESHSCDLVFHKEYVRRRSVQLGRISAIEQDCGL